MQESMRIGAWDQLELMKSESRENLSRETITHKSASRVFYQILATCHMSHATVSISFGLWAILEPKRFPQEPMRQPLVAILIDLGSIVDRFFDYVQSVLGNAETNVHCF